MRRPLRVAVIGGGECDAETAASASRVGRLLAEVGAVLVCGGLGGVMEAAARGAANAGGLTIGILPSDDARSASDGVIVPIPSGLGDARNALIVRAAHAVIAIGGAWGTLSEAAFCLKNDVPLITLHSDLPPLPVPTAASPEEAVEWALAKARERSMSEERASS